MTDGRLPSFLDFERPIAELEGKIEELRHLSDVNDLKIVDEIQRLQRRIERILRQTYGKLDPWQVVQVARHPGRPHCVDYLDALIDGFTERVGGRSTRGFRHAELTTMQLRLAESSAERDCAWLMLRRATRETAAAMRERGGLDLGQRARNRRDMAYVSVLCMRAADRLFQGVGAAGLFDGNDLRRRHADIRAIGAHHINSWDISGPIYGQVAFGLDPTNPLV